MFDNTSAAPLELLRFRPDFSSRPEFETALRRRVRALDRFRHPAVARIRAVQWLGDGEGLALVSNHVAGQRLSEVFHKARGPALAVGLIRQLAPVVAALQESGNGIAHGVITPERIVIDPGGRLVLVEHVLGDALNTLGLSRQQLQSEFGLALPESKTTPELDRSHDVLQLAFIALSLLLGRRLDPAEYPQGVAPLLDEYSLTHGRNADGVPRLRPWLQRALQLEDTSFPTALDAHDALNELLESETHRSFVSLYTADHSAAALAKPMSNKHQLVTTDDQEPAAITPWPIPTTAVDEFHSELEPRPTLAEVRRREAALPLPAPAPPRRFGPAMRWGLAVLALLVLAQTVVIVALMVRRGNAPPASDSSASQVNLAGVGANGASRSSAPSPEPTPPPVTTPAPVVPPPAPPPAVGGLDVTSDPPGARVTVDGDRRGVTPLTLSLPPGQHAVVISDGKTTMTRTVTVPAGGTASVVAALGNVAASAGWVTIDSPVELQVAESGALLGTTRAARIMLPAGKHQLDLSNSTVGFQTSIAVEIQPGKTATSSVTMPNGALSINALPWANVFVDGRAVGTTPVANIELPIGTHEVVYRHPQLGERRQTVVVTLKTPLRLVMDLNK